MSLPNGMIVKMKLKLLAAEIVVVAIIMATVMGIRFIRNEQKMLCKPGPKRPYLDALLAKAKECKMTEEELRIQRRNHVASEAAWGSDADEAAYRDALTRNDKEEIARLDKEAEHRRQRAIKIIDRL